MLLYLIELIVVQSGTFARQETLGNQGGSKKGHLRPFIVKEIQPILSCYKRAKLPTLYNRPRRLQDILMYKVKNGLCPDCIF